MTQHFTNCRAKCRYSGCQYMECYIYLYAEWSIFEGCNCAECRYTPFCYAECRSGECHFVQTRGTFKLKGTKFIKY